MYPKVCICSSMALFVFVVVTLCTSCSQSVLFTKSNTNMSAVSDMYSVPHEESKKIVFAHFASYLSN